MDITTIIGLVFAAIMIFYGAFSSGGISALGGLYDFPSLVITVGGTVASVFASNHLGQIKTLGKVIGKAFKNTNYDSKATIDSIIELANIARKEGLLALEEVAEKIENPFMKKAVNLMVDGTDPVLLKDILEAEISAMEGRHAAGAAMLDGIAAMGPAYGMLGTLIGLINMLKNLDDPSNLGGDMAVALVTTFYGSIIANVFATPVATKIRTRSGEEVMQMELILEGILSIHGGENPHIIQEKLLSFLSKTEKDGGGKKKKGKAETEEAESEG
ncbi:MAG: motility protein A [Oscillospiraceae bacterium]|jgi:chemotaxis protein MotA|nr:motility protein A [Oscillospiraceae bacterium]